MRTVALAIAFCWLPIACSKEGSHASHGPSQYEQTIKECELTDQLVATYISQGEFDFARAAVSSLRDTAKRLSEIAKKEISPKMFDEVETKIKGLLQSCEGTIRATQEGQKEGVLKAHGKLQRLLAELKEHSRHAAAPHQDH